VWEGKKWGVGGGVLTFGVGVFFFFFFFWWDRGMGDQIKSIKEGNKEGNKETNNDRSAMDGIAMELGMNEMKWNGMEWGILTHMIYAAFFFHFFCFRGARARGNRKQDWKVFSGIF
jgi:hypothetical protein